MPNKFSRILAGLFLMIAAVGLSVTARAQGPADAPAQTPSSVVDAAGTAPWGMAAANPQRTSWSPEEVRGNLSPLWYKSFDAYIPQRVQIIAANNLLYVATSAGLYALDAATGAESWVYPTAYPLGHSPTVTNSVAYVGGFDHKLHAINALTGAGLWTFEAGAGFQTNPLVVGDKVFLGNRDGYFYAVYAEGHPQAGTQAWRYKTDGPILYSAAYKNGVVYFASNDNYAYALNAETGALVWKSAKLPGAGFSSWWPVIYRDKVIFSGSNAYRFFIDPGPGDSLPGLELNDVYPNHATDPKGTLVGPLGTQSGSWVSGTPTIDASRTMTYFASKPWRRTYFVLNQSNGQETVTAPILWTGNDGAGNRYPPVVGADDVVYQQNSYMSDASIAGGQISGWKLGTPYISVISSDWGAVDEPHAASAGGNLIYWNLCCDRQAGAIDISVPKATLPPFGSAYEPNREYTYFNYNLESRIPGYNVPYYNPDTAYTKPFASFGGPNGVYGFHADTNPPIPYNGRVYMHRSNTVIAFAPSTGSTSQLPAVQIATAPPTTVTTVGATQLKTTLATEVQKMLDAGHLRPGYGSHGIFDKASKFSCGDTMVDYWHSTADTIDTLLRAYPHLSPSMQADVQTYLQAELTNYPPYQYNHIGWDSGANRERFDLPPEAETAAASYPPAAENYTMGRVGGWDGAGVWGRNPYLFYALWKYADTFGGAASLYNSSKNALAPLTSQTNLIKMPHVLNAYIAGYQGYLELEKLAGQPETASVRNDYNYLLQLKKNNFTADSAYSGFGSNNPTSGYCRTLNIANNFIFLTPELAQYMHDNLLTQVTNALTEYEGLAPYWFVSYAPEGFGEDTLTPLYDAHALFMARALILQEPGETLEPYLDVPAFARGDLFYIQKLVATIENYGLASPAADFVLSVTPSSQSVGVGGSANYNVQVTPVGGYSSTVTLSAGSSPGSLALSGLPVTVTPPANVTLTAQDMSGGTFGGPSLLYSIAITGTGGGSTKTDSTSLLVTASTQTFTSSRRVNVPYTTTTTGITVPPRAVFWFGQVGPTTSNYADTRLIYNDNTLFVNVHVFDRLLFYDQSPSAADLTAWDSVSLYLNLTGPTGDAPTTQSYRFVGQLNHAQERPPYEAVYQGDGSSWVTGNQSFSTIDGWQGNGLNDTTIDKGWVISFYIPFSSLGLSGPPAEGTTWGLAVAVHDRDDSTGSFIADTTWPEAANQNAPVSWGSLVFGLPSYSQPAVGASQTYTLRHGLNGVTVPDGHAGGSTTCAEGVNFWADWGSLNYSGATEVNIQNQWNLGDWPCFSKYFVTFPLDSLPADQEVVSATLTMYQFGNSNQDLSYPDPPEPSLIQVMTVADDWTEGGLTWNNAPLATENVSRAWVDPLPNGPPWPNVARQWDVSYAVAQAYQAGTPLKLALYSADNALHSGKYFRSSDFNDETARPTLRITLGQPDTSSMAVSPSSQSANVGDSVAFSINLTDGIGFNAITLSADNPAPGQLSLQFNPASLTAPGSATLTVTDIRSGGSGSLGALAQTITITATGEGQSKTTQVSVLFGGSHVYLPLIVK